MTSPRHDSFSIHSEPGTLENPLLDSSHTHEQIISACAGSYCPESLRCRQRVLTVDYFSFDRKIHRGQIVVHRAISQDIHRLFIRVLELKFPLQSVIPIGDPRFCRAGSPLDELSMEANNSSAFHYRTKTGKTQLSRHALGLAIDLNPVQNPFVRDGVILPPRASYDPYARGTLSADHPVVQEFRKLGWIWGGDWSSLKDWQHFEKPLNPL